MIRNLGFGSTIGACATLLATAGCSSDSGVDIGDGKRGEALSDYADVWDGYAEAYTFSDGSDRVRVNLDSDGKGFLEIGDTAPPPDPTAGGPPPEFGGISTILPGFRYPIMAASVEAKRLRLEAQQYPTFDAWCEEQPAVLFDPDEAPDVYSCFPYTEGLMLIDEELGSCGEEGLSEVVPCRLPYSCWSLCACAASGCEAASTTTPGARPEEYLTTLPPVQLDAALVEGGNTLDGTLVAELPETATGVGSQNVTIRLQRQ